MDKLQHTPTPWRIGAIESGQAAVDGAGAEEVTGFIEPEDARRIVACVNACAGVPTELLEEYPAPFSEMRARHDQLLAALEMARKKLEDEGYFPSNEIDSAIAAARGDK